MEKNLKKNSTPKIFVSKTVGHILNGYPKKILSLDCLNSV